VLLVTAVLLFNFVEAPLAFARGSFDVNVDARRYLAPHVTKFRTMCFQVVLGQAGNVPVDIVVALRDQPDFPLVA
jgi:hypothetical protein